MKPRELTDRTRQRIVALLGDDRLRRERLERRLKEIRTLEGIPSFSAVMHVLAHLWLPEDEAESLLGGLLEHRDRMSAALGRDPGLHVAAIDYLSNVKKLLANPAIVEMSQLELTERSAITDSLTDLHNRRYFNGCLDLEVRRSRRYQLSLSLLMLDLDSFKIVNDAHGHPFGDLVLRRAGQVVRRAVRESDIACRFGGEEFAVILPETERLGAYAVAERVRKKVERSFVEKPVEGRRVSMTISGGISTFPEDGQVAAELIRWADRALYRSKTAGRNRITLHHSERRSSVRYPARRSASARISKAGASGDARPVNLSQDGALLATRNEMQLRDVVEVVLRDRFEEWTVDARVVRVEEGTTANDGRLVAVEFDRPLSEEWLQRQVIFAGRRRPRRSEA